MAELEKVIKGLEICIRVQDNELCPDDCPYRKDICYGAVGVMNDALSLLKAQEPVKPYIDSDGRDVWRCGNCGAGIFHPEHTQADEDERNYNKFCRHCGMAVKWKLDKPQKEET